MKQERVERRSNDVESSNSERYKKINNEIAKQKKHVKVRWRVLKQTSLNEPVVCCKMTRLVMIRKSTPQLILPNG